MALGLGRLSTWARLERRAHATPSEQKSLQDRELRAIVRHAYDHVAFYRRLFDRAGVHPDMVRGAIDIERLPIVRRTELQSAPAEDATEAGLDPRATVSRRTGGSSGRPLTIVTRRDDLAYEALVWLRTWRRLGVRWRDTHVTIKDPVDAAPWSRGHWFQRIGVLRVRYLDISAAPDELARSLVRSKPGVLRGPPSALETLALHVRSTGQRVRPRLIFTSSERLEVETRELLESVFAAPVHDCYGATEAGCIAWRCPRCGWYHVNSDSVLVEVVRDGVPVRPGETGEVVITNLFSRAMPFIRYALGDLARLGDPCPDAPGLMTLRELCGRNVQPIVVSDGTRLSPYSFMPDEVPGIIEYRIVQDAPDRIRILVVPGPGFRPDALEQARRDSERRAGRKTRVVVELRDSLPPRADHAAARADAP